MGTEPAVHIHQEQRAGRLVGMLVVVASEASGASQASLAAAGGMALPWAFPLRQNSSLEGRKVHKLESMARRSLKTVCCLVWRAWLGEELESLVQPKQAGGTVAVHCNKSTGRYWDMELPNTAEDIAELALQAVEGIGVPVELGLLGGPVVLEHTGYIVVAVAVPRIGTDLAGMGPGMGIGQRLEPWDLLEDCNRLGHIRVHRHPGILQGRSG